MFGIFPLLPANGKDYKSMKELQADWLAGKDFKTAFNKPCSIRDFENGALIEVRYAKQMKYGAFKNAK